MSSKQTSLILSSIVIIMCTPQPKSEFFRDKPRFALAVTRGPGDAEARAIQSEEDFLILTKLENTEMINMLAFTTKPSNFKFIAPILQMLTNFKFAQFKWTDGPRHLEFMMDGYFLTISFVFAVTYVKNIRLRYRTSIFFVIPEGNQAECYCVFQDRLVSAVTGNALDAEEHLRVMKFLTMISRLPYSTPKSVAIEDEQQNVVGFSLVFIFKEPEVKYLRNIKILNTETEAKKWNQIKGVSSVFMLTSQSDLNLPCAAKVGRKLMAVAWGESVELYNESEMIYLFETLKDKCKWLYEQLCIHQRNRSKTVSNTWRKVLATSKSYTCQSTSDRLPNH